MAELPLNLVNDRNLLINKGDALIVEGHSGPAPLIIVCPGCGKPVSCEKHAYDRETQSYTPSIIHDIDYGGCGWHGWLTDGVFKGD